jgi:hypothetical protein
LPHSGRQLLWEFRDSSHGEAYRRCSTMVTMGPARDRANRDTSIFLGSGPSLLEVNPYFLPASYWLDSIDYNAPRAVRARGGRRRSDLPYAKGPGPLI